MALVHMHHKDIEAPATASEKAFETIYQPKGWQRLPEPERAATDYFGRLVRSVQDLKAEELRELTTATVRGYAPAKSATKDEMAKAYLASFPGVDGPEPEKPAATAAQARTSQSAPKTQNQE